MITTLIVVSFAIYLIGTYADWRSTLAFMSRPGFTEKNRLTRWFMARLGIKLGLGLKTLIVDIAAGLIMF